MCEEERDQAISTNHSRQRTKDRLGLSKNLSDKKAQSALDLGLSHSELTGNLRRYVDGLFLKKREANNIRVYRRHVYLFTGNVCITILNLPYKYHSVEDKLWRRKYPEQTSQD